MEATDIPEEGEGPGTTTVAEGGGGPDTGDRGRARSSLSSRGVGWATLEGEDTGEERGFNSTSVGGGGWGWGIWGGGP